MTKPAVYFLINSTIPYIQHLCRRLSNEIDQVQWTFGFTRSDGNWETDWPKDARVFYLWQKDQAEQMWSDLRESGLKAAILSGYAAPEQRRMAALCRKRNVPYFVRGDSNIRGERQKPFYKRLIKQFYVRRFLSGAAGAMPMGRLGKQFFQYYGVRPEHMYLVPHEPDYAQFQSISPDAVQRFCQENGLDASRNFILCCNRLVNVKRVDLVIDAFNRLADEFDQYDLMIVGDGPLKSELQSAIRKDLTGRVHWLGRRQLADVIRAFHCADVFVLASDYEPWATVISEAAAAGVPIVASDVVGAAHEVFQNGSGGRLFTSQSGDSLVAELREVIQPANLPRYRENIQRDLDQWRRIGDPVGGVRAALAGCGVLP